MRRWRFPNDIRQAAVKSCVYKAMSIGALHLPRALDARLRAAGGVITPGRERQPAAGRGRQ